MSRAEDHLYPPRPGRAARRWPAAALLVAALGAVAAVLAGGLVGSVPSAVRGPGAVLKPPYVPSSGAYLGLDPNFVRGRAASFQAQLFESRTGRALGIVSYYVDFGALPSMVDVAKVAQRRSVPMINMNCGAPDPSIAAGRRDRELRAVARVLKAYGGPVLFRWFWEMNLPNVNGHPACLAGAAGPGYVAAYRHIWTIFHDVGARNVAFVWCPSDAHSAQHQTDATYWPGSAYVDWVAADLYDRGTVKPSFGNQFRAFYAYWTAAAPGKPIMLAETGAVGSPTQVQWLAQILSALTTKDSRVPGTPFPEVHAVVYVDAVDLHDYVLRKDTSGMEEFAAVERLPYFSVLSPALAASGADRPRRPSSAG